MNEIYSLEEYLMFLRGLKENGIDRLGEDVRYYYRGEPEDYGLTSGEPGINRGGWLNGCKESDLFHECERRLPGEFANCRSTFEKLVIMQHYGVPTRLLDISLDPLVALFFALYMDPLRNGSRAGNGVVIAYEVPTSGICNHISDKVSVVSNVSAYRYDDLDLDSLPGGQDAFNACPSIHHLLHQIRAEKPHFRDEIVKDHLSKVYCIHPLLDNARIRVQQGAFLLFGLDGDRHHLAKLEKSNIRMLKIRIPSKVKVSLLDDLLMLGKTVDTIYPDWRGTCDYFASFYDKSIANYYEVK